jgi:hypothetical protein
MRRIRLTVLLAVWPTLVAVPPLAGQTLEIGIVDFYGVNRVPVPQLRRALTMAVGDTFSIVGDQRPAFLAESEQRVLKVRGVSRARANLVCCNEGRAILFIGILEDGAPALQFRAAPEGAERLAADVVDAERQYSEALTAAVQRGDAGEDDSQGHALAHDSATRAAQQRFIRYAARDLPQLRLVLRHSSDAEHRALAAQVLGYVADKQSVVDDLVDAMSDPAEGVRNNAMRTLLVFAAATPSSTRPAPSVPFTPFVALLNSLVWSDRNKASGALSQLSAKRDPALLKALRTQATAPLVEMARWKSASHAIAAYFILGRIAGLSDAETQEHWARGEREAVIEAALKSRS